jgi:hypothetical protein
MRPSRSFDEASAKRFLIDRVAAQATREGKPLSEAETYMLAWSEADPGFSPDAELDSVFDAKTTPEEFESSISALLRRAYRADVAADPSVRSEYLAAYDRLKKNDHYIAVMLDPALGVALHAGVGFNRVGLAFLVALRDTTVLLLICCLFAANARHSAFSPRRAVETAVIAYSASLIAVTIARLLGASSFSEWGTAGRRSTVPGTVTVSVITGALAYLASLIVGGTR